MSELCGGTSLLKISRVCRFDLSTISSSDDAFESVSSSNPRRLLNPKRSKGESGEPKLNEESESVESLLKFVNNIFIDTMRKSGFPYLLEL